MRWLLSCDQLQSRLRLLRVVSHNIEVNLQVLPQIGLIEDWQRVFVGDVCAWHFSVVQRKYTLAAHDFLQVKCA